MKKLFVFLVFSCLTACSMVIQTTPIQNVLPSVILTATSSVLPTITPTATTIIRPTATITPELTTYRDTELNLQISYPKNWVEISRGVFIGSDGYLIIKKLEQYDSLSIIHVALDFANSNYANDNIGVGCAGWGYGCLLMNGYPELKNGKFISVIPYVHGKDSAKYFSLEYNEPYYSIIQRSLRPYSLTEKPTEYLKDIQIQKPIKKRFAEGITIQEFPQTDAAGWYDNEFSPGKEIAYNCGINPNRKNPTFTMNTSTTHIAINRNDQTIYSYTSLIGDSKPDSFCTWDNNWMFEIYDNVIMNGKVLNHELHYDEMFSWHLMDDQPTFFVRNKGKYQISFAGKLIPFYYDEIFHNRCFIRGGCEGRDRENPRTDGLKTWFRAKRGNTWFMVVVSAN